ncbi:hypothetical protein [Oceanobacillus zhaokaii]|nr:hypothetical protein [Oceanobacillus zhaokaii]
MAISPSGSLLEFNKNANELSTDIINKKKEIDVIKPTDEQE